MEPEGQKMSREQGLVWTWLECERGNEEGRGWLCLCLGPGQGAACVSDRDMGR